ncbi:MAG: diguanylate cyclase, partial [Pseudoalteromonas tetraodonis]|nr:diguanylate cyclase [Pseudoalteromonas tetraodonis]
MNNRFGMEYGDKAIKAYAAMLQATFAAPYLVFRNSGNEFCIITPHLADEQNRRAFEQILASSIEQYETKNTERPLNMSVGVANYPEHDITKSKLVRS